MEQSPKIIFIMGATGTGKSKLSVDIATRFPVEIINSDKIQAYEGLDIVTNKLPVPDRRGVPHHLLSFIPDPAADFSSEEFASRVLESATDIIARGKSPIVVGGSNSYLEALVSSAEFLAANFQPLFIHLDADLSVLFHRVDYRVDKMIAAGAVDELREFVEPGADFSQGIWRAIGVPEMEKYLFSSGGGSGRRDEGLLAAAIGEMKENTRRLVTRQAEKIRRLREEAGWEILRVDPTEALELREDTAETEALWNEQVLNPSLEMVANFLGENYDYDNDQNDM